MTQRFNILDIVVGVGMCAIMFGAVVFFLAATGILEGAPPSPVVGTQAFEVMGDRQALQPLIGQAVVDQARQAFLRDQNVADSSREFVRASLAHHELESIRGGPFGGVMREAGAMAADHAARVQAVMGRAIVNFTQRGMRTGAIARGGDEGMFNVRMISAVEDFGQRLDDEFTSTWQVMLGRRIVQATQDYSMRAGMIQERLGSALVGMATAQHSWEDARPAGQYRLASLTLAARRSDLMAGSGSEPRVVAPPTSEESFAVARSTASPGISIGLLVVALAILGGIYLAGLIAAAHAREAKALAQNRRDASRWAFKLAT